MGKYIGLSNNHDQNKILQQAINHVILGRDNQAIQTLAAILKANPKDSEAWLWFARTSNNLKKIDIALKNASSISANDPEIDEERRKFKSAVASGCKGSSVLKHCCFCWAPVLKNVQTCHYCNAHLDVHENFFHSKFFDYSEKTINQQNILDAFQRLTKASIAEPKVAFLHFCLAMTHINLDQWDEALDELLLAKSINPGCNPYESQLEILSDFMDDLGSFFSGDTLIEEKALDNQSKQREKRILVVEDSTTTRTVIRRMLSQKGYVVVEAKDGIDALRKYEERAPDMILLDIIMPGMDGYQTLSALKKNHDLGNTPVIMLSAKGKLIDKMKGKMAGSTEYLTKPFNTFQLMKKIEQHLVV